MMRAEPNEQYKVLFVIAVTTLVAFALYMPSYQFGFVWDDFDYIVNAHRGRLSEPVFSRLLDNFFESKNYFRPAVVATFITQLKFFGSDNPGVFHLANVILHSFNVALVSGFFYRMLGEKLERPSILIAAMFICVAYAASPLLLESVAWISGRFDLLFTSFSLCLILLTLKIKQTLFSVIACFVLYLFAALSKEHAVVLPVLLPLLWCYFSEEYMDGRLSFGKLIAGKKYYFLAIVLSGLFYLVLRYFFLGHFFHPREDLLYQRWSVLHLILVLRAIGGYCFHLLYPFYSLGPSHPFDFNEPLSTVLQKAEFFAGMMIPLVLVVLYKLIKPLFFAVLTMVVSLLPVMHLLPMFIDDDYIAMRFFAFPVAVFFLLLSRLFKNELQPKVQHLPSVLAGFFSVSSLIVFSQNLPFWSSDLSLWTWSYQEEPGSIRTVINYLSENLRIGNFDKVIDVSERELEIYDKNATLLNNLALAYWGKKQYGNAKNTFERLFDAVKSSDLRAIYYANYGQLLLERFPESKDAKKIIERAVMLDPYLVQARLNMAILLASSDLNKAKLMAVEALGLAAGSEKNAHIKRLEGVAAFEGVDWALDSK